MKIRSNLYKCLYNIRNNITIMQNLKLRQKKKKTSVFFYKKSEIMIEKYTEILFEILIFLLDRKFGRLNLRKKSYKRGKTFLY